MQSNTIKNSRIFVLLIGIITINFSYQLGADFKKTVNGIEITINDCATRKSNNTVVCGYDTSYWLSTGLRPLRIIVNNKTDKSVIMSPESLSIKQAPIATVENLLYKNPLIDGLFVGLNLSVVSIGLFFSEYSFKVLRKIEKDGHQVKIRTDEGPGYMMYKPADSLEKKTKEKVVIDAKGNIGPQKTTGFNFILEYPLTSVLGITALMVSAGMCYKMSQKNENDAAVLSKNMLHQSLVIEPTQSINKIVFIYDESYTGALTFKIFDKNKEMIACFDIDDLQKEDK
jgi:hypothetical protein